ncbi:MAG TPA: YihY/virulence factor BrkB family protein [Kribbella sp.]|nr:YihY/virulence factor BrkB family protein [Kribbella sp.]
MAIDRNGAGVRQDAPAADQAARVPGGAADKPVQIPARGWWQILRRAWAEAKADQVPLLAAGVAFFAFLSLFPAMIAAVMAYGLIADPGQIRSQAEDLAAAMPSSARDLLLQQVDALTSAPRQSLGIGLVIALAIALWSASGGVGYLITAVNMAYDEDETRGFVRRKGLALTLTLGTIVFVLLAAALLAVGPAIIGDNEVSTPIRVLVEGGRLILAVVLISVALATMYRLAPDRDAPRVRWVSIGAAVATIIWLLASIGFSVYVATFGNYAKTYGSLAAVVVLMLWLWLSAYAVLLGAEINAESEGQTIRDTTRGAPQPLGRRGAVKADSVPPS